MAALGLTPADPKALTAERINGLFAAVDRGLGGIPLPAAVGIVVVGGAAVAMQWNPARVTHDVDVVSERIPAEFWKIVTAVAEAEGLDDDWLNTAARVKAPTGPTPGEPTEIYRGSNLRVYGASPHFVLAMKLLSGRGIDLGDMPALLEAARPRSSDELYDLVEGAYPNAQIPAASRYIIEEVWGDYAAAHPERVQDAGGKRRDHRVSLSVQPALSLTAGWDVAIRTPEGLTLRRSGLYPSKEDAEAAARFAVDVVDVHYPLRFAGSPHGHTDRTADAVTVSIAGSGAEHRLVAATPDGELVAYSDTHTAVGAYNALAFVEALAGMVGDPRGRRAMRVKVDEACGCRDLGKGPCRHREAVVPDTNPISVSVRPHRTAPQGWELVVRDGDGSPLRLSDPYPSEAAAESARDFILRVVNGEYPIRFEGRQSWLGADGPGYSPPAVEDAAVTVRVTPPPPSAPNTWRLQARRSDGYVVVTSLPYPTYPSADSALDFVGALSVLAGDPERTGRVKDTTQPTDRVCDCRSLGAACLHFEIDDPDTRGHAHDERGPYLGL